VDAVTLVEFLTAMLDRDEAAVRRIADCDYFHGVESDAEVEVLRFADPARVLAEVEAKRRIIAEHADGEDHECEPRFGEIDWTTGRQHLLPCPTLRLLALPYADHEDYDEAWRP
jgi:hypothetical protein